VVVIERNRAAGEKIRISGGGRCNFTNRQAGLPNYLSHNPRFCLSALSRFTPADFISRVEGHGIAFHEKKLGQLFCDTSSQDIIRMLLFELAAADGALALEETVDRVERHDGFFTVHTNRGGIEAASVVVATGGLSIPKLGATGIGYQIAEDFGLPIVPHYPALVPLLWGYDDAERFADLSGLSVDAVASIGKTSFRENLLFTHRGLSGPVVLQISSYWDGAGEILFDLLPEKAQHGHLAEEKRRGNKAEIKTVLAHLLPSRLAERWCFVHAWGGPINTQKDSTLEAIEQSLRRWRVVPAGTEGYKKAEVTGGGVDTRALDPKTMQARDVAGLYFIGEVVDITGWLGGYNFQWAWASGFAAGNAV